MKEEHQAQLWFPESMDAIDRAIQGTSDLQQMMGDVLDAVLVIFKGCGSFEVSWLRCEDMAVAVSGVVDAFVLAAEVEAPVVLEVAGGDGARSLRTASAPSRPHLRPLCPFCP